MSGFKNRTRPFIRGRGRDNGQGRGKDTENVTEDSPPKSSYYATEPSVKSSRRSLTQGSTELCERYVSGPCYCSRLHHSKRSPYVWQYQIMPEVWSLMSNVQMELLEQAFCNNEDGTVVEIKRFGDVKQTTVTFDEILDPPSKSSGNKFSFQRLSTRSYAEAGSDPIILYTNWVWYWKDNADRWSPFVPPELQLTLETKYLAGQDTYLYTIADQEYRLDFTSLVQVNRKYLTRRPVQRRPMFITLEGARSRLQTSSSLLMSPATVPPTDVPSNWTPLDRYQNSEKVELDTSSDEFTTVMSSIYKTLSANRCQVQRVYRLQNALLWHNFLSMKKTLQMSHSTESIDQRQLFHGTDTLDVVNNICINNFDFRVSGKNATLYGNGAYFARDAKYSHCYTKGRDRYMFLARVLVGKYTLGDSSYTRPPPRKGHVLYDSCVNDINNPSIFIIFERNQCYPEYLVEYRDGTADESVYVNRRNGQQGTGVTNVSSALKPLQPVPAVKSPTKPPSVKSTGNSSLNQNQSSPATNTSVTSALKHSSPVQPVPAVPYLTKTPSVKSPGNSSLNQNQLSPATNTSVTSALKHSSPVQPVPAVPYLTKTPSVKSSGNSSLNQNQSSPATNTSVTSALKHSSPVQPVPAVPYLTKTPSVKSSGNSSLNQNQSSPATNTSVTSALKHSSPVQPVPAVPYLTKTPSVKSSGNSSPNQNQTIPATNTVSASTSSSNHRQANPGQTNTRASPVHTPLSNRRSSAGTETALALGGRGHGQDYADQHLSPVQPVQAVPSPTKTPSVKSTGNSSLIQNQPLPATSTVSASSTYNNQSLRNAGQSNTNTSSLTSLPRSSAGNTPPRRRSPAWNTPPRRRRSSAWNTPPRRRRSPVGNGMKGGGQDFGDRWSVIDDLSKAEKTIRTGRRSSTDSSSDDDIYGNLSFSDKRFSNTELGLLNKSSSDRTNRSVPRQSDLPHKPASNAGLRISSIHSEIDNSSACSQNNQSQIYYRFSSTRNTAIYVRARDTENSATFPRFVTTGKDFKPVAFSPEKKRKDCTIM